MGADALIKSITSRLGSKLSISKGKKLSSIENDPLVTQNVHSLVELSVYKIDVAISALIGILQDTLKVLKINKISNQQIPQIPKNLHFLRFFMHKCLY